jgi:hypothetical protein
MRKNFETFCKHVKCKLEVLCCNQRLTVLPIGSYLGPRTQNFVGHRIGQFLRIVKHWL